MMAVHEDYIHNKTGNVYTILLLGSVQIDDVWHDSVTYSDGTAFYTRTVEDFRNSFTIIERGIQ